jgi:hypothetical protein
MSVRGIAQAGDVAEAVYEELLGHVHDCRRCWEWREALWRRNRLCPAGADLVDAYAAAVCGEEHELSRPSGRIDLRVINGGPDRDPSDVGTRGTDLAPSASQRGGVRADLAAGMVPIAGLLLAWDWRATAAVAGALVLAVAARALLGLAVHAALPPPAPSRAEHPEHPR